MNDSVISVQNLGKRFSEKTILKNVNIEFRRGESVAILGNNGTGKSTFIRMLCGLTSVTSGKVITNKEIKFNYIPENYSKINITVNEYLKSMGEFDKVPKKQLQEKLDNLYKIFYLENYKDVKMNNLSKGSLQKVGIIQAFIVKPDVLLLDEPLTGLDKNSQKNFIKLVKDFISEGVTVIMCCHEGFLVDELSDRILRIENQTIVETENKEDIYSFMTFECKDNINNSLVTELNTLCDYSEDNGLLKIKIKSDSSNHLLIKMLQRGYILKDFKQKGL